MAPPDAHEPVPGGADTARPLNHRLDIVPMVEGALDRVGEAAVPRAHIVHGGVREHHAPAEGVVGPVALDHRYLMAGFSFFIRNAK